MVVDGLFRNDCLVAASKSLKEDGIIILDNTNYAKELAFGTTYMQEQNFKRLDF